MTSHNQNDVINRYCGHCRKFLAENEYVIAPYRPLDATDKALITYYAFISLCDDIADDKTGTILAELSLARDPATRSRLLQMIYAKKAIDYLKQDGLLK
jgi:hypothetical protein